MHKQLFDYQVFRRLNNLTKNLYTFIFYANDLKLRNIP